MILAFDDVLNDYIKVRCENCEHWTALAVITGDYSPKTLRTIGLCPRLSEEVYDEVSVFKKTPKLYTDADCSCEFFEPCEQAVEDAQIEYEEDKANAEDIWETEQAMLHEAIPQNYLPRPGVLHGEI